MLAEFFKVMFQRYASKWHSILCYKIGNILKIDVCFWNLLSTITTLFFLVPILSVHSHFLYSSFTLPAYSSNSFVVRLLKSSIIIIILINIKHREKFLWTTIREIR